MVVCPDLRLPSSRLCKAWGRFALDANRAVSCHRHTERNMMPHIKSAKLVWRSVYLWMVNILVLMQLPYNTLQHLEGIFSAMVLARQRYILHFILDFTNYHHLNLFPILVNGISTTFTSPVSNSICWEMDFLLDRLLGRFIPPPG